MFGESVEFGEGEERGALVGGGTGYLLGVEPGEVDSEGGRFGGWEVELRDGGCDG